MKPLEYMAVADEAMTRIKKGAFLTAQTGERLNTMTIGWAMIGFVWQKPMFMVAVRDSRYTYAILENAADFTVSIPSGDLHDALMYCGTKSGRDVDKFTECGLKTANGRSVISPIIDTPGIHYECKIQYKTAMDPAFLDAAYDKLYPEKDYHTLYFGEIQSCYEL
ncbi:MAG: flavin reductase family protein [Desulfobacteraceae bacterium]|nr:flavin reductase family protein [Desulfobacteraceae bacterium]